MIFYMNLVSIVIAVSLDGFGVGIAYGLRKIRISLLALLIIMLCSGIIVLTSMLIGHVLRMFISPTITTIFGGIILILLGLFVFISLIRSNVQEQSTITHSAKQVPHRKQKNKIKHFTAVISDPHKADKDQSGSISATEAIVLGTALALDAFGAGLGAAMLGYSPVVTAILIASMSGIFVFSGIHIGNLLSKTKTLAMLTYVPPILLICIGIYNVS